MLVQIHILQSYAPSNLNRDENNSPKMAVFGDYDRGRVSSQCLKRTIRTSDIFKVAFKDDGWLAERTKLLPQIVEAELREMAKDDPTIDEATIKAIVGRVHEIGKATKKDVGGQEGEETLDEPDEKQEKPKGKKGRGKKTQDSEGETDKTKQLIFIAPNEKRPFAEKLLAVYRKHGPDKWAELKVEDITKEMGPSLPRSVDIAMFGRMTTTDAFKDIEAAVQVAHAISTHRVARETDYYTAVDDLSDTLGAGMLGDTEFNSCVYYKYTNAHWEGLVENLGGDTAITRQAILSMVEAAITAQPTGKQNAFAHHQVPDLVLVEVSERNLPVSYANAFHKPARHNEEQDLSLMDDSARKFSDYVARVSKAYNLSAPRAFLAVQDYTVPGATRVDSLADLLSWLESHLPR